MYRWCNFRTVLYFVHPVQTLSNPNKAEHIWTNTTPPPPPTKKKRQGSRWVYGILTWITWINILILQYLPIPTAQKQRCWPHLGYQVLITEEGTDRLAAQFCLVSHWPWPKTYLLMLKRAYNHNATLRGSLLSICGDIQIKATSPLHVNKLLLRRPFCSG